MSKKKAPIDEPAGAMPVPGETPAWTQAGILGYVGLMLLVDTLAGYQVEYGLDWSNFMWQSAWGFDYFKFLFWFVIPLGLCWPLDPGWLSAKGWKKIDLAILGAILLVGFLAMLIIPRVASLQDMYGGMVDLAKEDLVTFVMIYLSWTGSWLMGWELIHRYWILRALGADLANRRWLIIPVYEGLYHLQKPALEAVGMVIFSLVLTSWAIRRQNVMLPLVAHLLVELDLLAFVLIAASTA